MAFGKIITDINLQYQYKARYNFLNEKYRVDMDGYRTTMTNCGENSTFSFNVLSNKYNLIHRTIVLNKTMHCKKNNVNNY